MAARWYFGWNIVAAAAFLTLLSTGMRLSFGPFFLPMAHDLGFSRSEITSVAALCPLFFVFSAPPRGEVVGVGLVVG